MFFVASVGAYHVAMFHLFTHAFLKLYFLGSGSVIHAFKDEHIRLWAVRKKTTLHLCFYVDRNLGIKLIFYLVFTSTFR